MKDLIGIYLNCYKKENQNLIKGLVENIFKNASNLQDRSSAKFYI